MKTFRFAVAAALLALLSALPAQAQGPQYPSTASPLHFVGGQFNAAAYATWSARIISGNTGTGAGTSIIVTAPGPLLDNTQLPITTLLNTSTPVSINDANAETFTPSGVTIAPCPAGNIGVGGSQNCATVTGTIANTHGPSAFVVSGDQGVEEAIIDAGQQGGGIVNFGVDCGNVTLNTGGLVTTTTNCQVPLSEISMAGSVVVKTTASGPASYGVGTTTTSTAFVTACTSLTAGTNCQQFQTAPTKIAGASLALTPVLVTALTTNFAAGVFHIKVFGYSQVNSAQ